MDTQRLILFFIFGFSLLMLWDAWEKDHRPMPVAQVPRASSPAALPTPAAKPGAQPAAAATPAQHAPDGSVPGAAAPAAKGERIVVRTDLVVAEIDTLGATLKRVELLKHKEAKDSLKNLVLLGPEHQYEAQSGLSGEGGPNHRTLWSVQPGDTTLGAGEETLEVRLSAQGKDGLTATKLYRFKRDSYVIEVALEIGNAGAQPVSPYAYFQLTHDGKSSADANAIAETFGAQSFNGFAVYSEEKKFQKVPLTELDKGKADYIKQASDGWFAYVQHYFVAGWLPAAKVAREYALEKRADGIYVGRALIAAGAIAPGGSATVGVPLYAGPQEQSRLAAVAPGFDLVVDYGWLAIIAWPLFWL
ncbi:MAG: membrane protein insertase YidC, partial [Terriglobales bacterium]